MSLIYFSLGSGGVLYSSVVVGQSTGEEAFISSSQQKDMGEMFLMSTGIYLVHVQYGITYRRELVVITQLLLP